MEIGEESEPIEVPIPAHPDQLPTPVPATEPEPAPEPEVVPA